ncbi:hypothetical protein AX15_003533 [Amanita polypyramis BW_CC]|nr:hypothetical protein AX15_003533 [Amanita polypyramis BW_CC]
MHVYHTALPFAPPGSLLFKTYEQEADNAVRVLVGVDRQWSPCLSAIACGGGVNAVAYASDGSRLATGNTMGTTAVWDALSASRLLVLEEPGGSEITSITFLSNDSRLVSGSKSKTITLWDVISGASIRTYQGHTEPVTCLSASSRNPHIFVSGAEDGTIRIWDATSEDCTLVIPCHDSPVSSVAVLPDGTQILSGSKDGIVRLWSRSTGAELKQFELHTTAVLSLAINDFEGLKFASASESSGIKICNLPRGTDVVVHDSEDKVPTMAFSPDGKILAYPGRGWRNIILWNCSDGQVSAIFRHQGVRQLAFNPQGTRLSSVSSDGTCRLWDITRLGDTDDDSVVHSGWVIARAFSGDGSWLATGGDHNDQTVHLWDSALGRHSRPLKGHEWGIYSLAFSPDNRFLASGSGDRTVRIWDVMTGQTLIILLEQDWVKTISFSDEGNQVVTRTPNFTRTWNLENALPVTSAAGDHQQELPILADSISCVNEENPDAPSGIGGISDGFQFWMDQDRWMMFGASRGYYRRATFIFQEYRICGFAFHKDRAVLSCVDGQVLLLDLSRMKKEYTSSP